MEKLQKRHIESIRAKINKTIREFDLIRANDRIMVGLSGGKDSMVLLENLAMQKKYFKVPFDIVAVHINITNIAYETDINYLTAFCNEWDVPFLAVDREIDNKKPDKTPCFICSWGRRKELFQLTKDHNCNKLALGHHADDATETFLLNLIYHGSISSLPQSISMFNGRLELIRPLLHLKNAELQEYADIRGYEKEKKLCPHTNSTKRDEVKNIIKLMEELNPGARTNLFKAMDNSFPEYLPKSLK